MSYKRSAILYDLHLKLTDSRFRMTDFISNTLLNQTSSQFCRENSICTSVSARVHIASSSSVKSVTHTLVIMKHKIPRCSCYCFARCDLRPCGLVRGCEKMRVPRYNSCTFNTCKSSRHSNPRVGELHSSCNLGCPISHPRCVTPCQIPKLTQ